VVFEATFRLDGGGEIATSLSRLRFVDMVDRPDVDIATRRCRRRNAAEAEEPEL
jgi:hypothetical protein